MLDRIKRIRPVDYRAGSFQEFEEQHLDPAWREVFDEINSALAENKAQLENLKAKAK